MHANYEAHEPGSPVIARESSPRLATTPGREAQAHGEAAARGRAPRMPAPAPGSPAPGRREPGPIAPPWWTELLGSLV